VLYEHCQKREVEHFRAEAALHGAKIELPKTRMEVKEDTFAFRDPGEYKHLPDEEKKRLTEKMMGAHKRWSQGRRHIGKSDG